MKETPCTVNKKTLKITRYDNIKEALEVGYNSDDEQFVMLYYAKGENNE